MPVALLSFTAFCRAREEMRVTSHDIRHVPAVRPWHPSYRAAKQHSRITDSVKLSGKSFRSIISGNRELINLNRSVVNHTSLNFSKAEINFTRFFFDLLI